MSVECKAIGLKYSSVILHIMSIIHTAFNYGVFVCVCGNCSEKDPLTTDYFVLHSGAKNISTLQEIYRFIWD